MKELAKKNGVNAETRMIEVTNALEQASEKIVQTADELKVDLIVLGTHGRRGFNRLILGSVAEETLRTSTIPVLLINSNQSI